MQQERTLVLIKPDGVQRGLSGEIIARFERKGLKLVGLKLLKLPYEKAEELYVPHKGKFFYDYLIQFMTSTILDFITIYKQHRLPKSPRLRKSMLAMSIGYERRGKWQPKN